MLTDGATDKLARRVRDLLTNDAQFAAALPDKEVCEKIVRPGIGWAELMQVVTKGYADRPALGSLGASHDVCPADCCLYSPERPAVRG